MKKIVALPAPTTRTPWAKYVAWAYAVVLVVMAVGQLFAFEDFIPLLQSYWLPGGHAVTALIAGLAVCFEVLSLPYLLRMPLSPLMRLVSIVSSVAVPVLWLYLSYTVIYSKSALVNSGLFGIEVIVPAGWATFVISLALLILAAICVWALVPKIKK